VHTSGGPLTVAIQGSPNPEFGGSKEEGLAKLCALSHNGRPIFRCLEDLRNANANVKPAQAAALEALEAFYSQRVGDADVMTEDALVAACKASTLRYASRHIVFHALRRQVPNTWQAKRHRAA
jgi:hypothetical protein